VIGQRQKTHILLLGLYFSDGVDVVLVPDLVLAHAQGDHASLDAHGLEHGTAELVRAARQLAPVDRRVDLHLARVDLENLGASLLVGQRELDLAVKTAGPEQGGIQDVDTVRGGDDLDPVVRGEAVELVEKLQHGPLYFTVAALLAVETLGTNGIQLVDEDDRRGLLLGESEAVADKFGAVAYEHLHKLRAGELEEGRVGLSSACPRKQCLACAGGAVHQGA
jgi:hypothetical protein